MAAPNLPVGFDFTDPDIYATRLPTEELAEVRRAAPIWRNEQAPGRTHPCTLLVVEREVHAADAIEY